MSVSYIVNYDCTISGSWEDFEKIPAIVRKISDDEQARWDSMMPEEQRYHNPSWTRWYKENTEAIATGAEKALASGGTLAFEFTAEEDDISHGIMEDIMNTLDAALPSLAIFLVARVNYKWTCTFVSWPGKSSLELTEEDLSEGRCDWGDEDTIYENCEKVTCLRLPEDLKLITSGKQFSIRASDFKGFTNLTDLVLSKTVKITSKTAFKDCKNLTIHAPAGSYAEEYAKERGIPFQVLDE